MKEVDHQEECPDPCSVEGQGQQQSAERARGLGVTLNPLPGQRCEHEVGVNQYEGQQPPHHGGWVTRIHDEPEEAECPPKEKDEQNIPPIRHSANKGLNDHILPHSSSPGTAANSKPEFRFNRMDGTLNVHS